MLLLRFCIHLTSTLKFLIGWCQRIRSINIDDVFILLVLHLKSAKQVTVAHICELKISKWQEIRKILICSHLSFA